MYRNKPARWYDKWGQGHARTREHHLGIFHDGNQLVPIDTSWVGVSPVLNAKSLGAKGDGSTDDTTAIQDAISELHDMGGGSLWFPDGTYPVAMEQEAIRGKNRIRLTGGRGAMLKHNGPVFRMFGIAECDDWLIEGLTIDLNSAVSTEIDSSDDPRPISFSFRACKRVRIMDCYFKDSNPVTHSSTFDKFACQFTGTVAGGQAEHFSFIGNVCEDGNSQVVVNHIKGFFIFDNTLEDGQEAAVVGVFFTNADQTVEDGLIAKNRIIDHQATAAFRCTLDGSHTGCVAKNIRWLDNEITYRSGASFKGTGPDTFRFGATNLLEAAATTMENLTLSRNKIVVESGYTGVVNHHFWLFGQTLSNLVLDNFDVENNRVNDLRGSSGNGVAFEARRLQNSRVTGNDFRNVKQGVNVVTEDNLGTFVAFNFVKLAADTAGNIAYRLNGSIGGNTWAYNTIYGYPNTVFASATPYDVTADATDIVSDDLAGIHENDARNFGDVTIEDLTKGTVEDWRFTAALNSSYLLRVNDGAIKGALFLDANRILTLGGAQVVTSANPLTLHVRGDGTGAIPSLHAATRAVISRTASPATDVFLSIISGNAALAGIRIGDTDGELRGAVLYDNANETLDFYVDGSERARLTSGGYISANTIGSTGGTTALRPGTPSAGQQYYDTDLNKYIFWNGSAWVNMDGTAL